MATVATDLADERPTQIPAPPSPGDTPVVTTEAMPMSADRDDGDLPPHVLLWAFLLALTYVLLVAVGMLATWLAMR